MPVRQTGWLGQQTLIFHSAGDQELQGQGASMVRFWGGPSSWHVAAFQLYPHMAQRKQALWTLPIREFIHHEDSIFMTSSVPNYFPKAPPPNTITLRIKISTYEFWRDTNIQATALLQTLLDDIENAPQKLLYFSRKK